MGDFFQNGVVTSLHRLNRNNESLLANKLVKYNSQRPVALVLPALFMEFTGEAFPKIVDELTTVPYVTQVVLSLGKANKEEFLFAKKFLSRLPQETVIVWNDGPRMRELYKKLEEEFYPWESGKGLAAWIGYGYILACNKCDVIVCHDCDILTYQREILTRLCYPIANTQLNYEFCKGYYSRVTDRLHGRVTRLFVTPLIRALMRILGRTPFLVYLDSFRYPLAGEFAMTSELAWRIRTPADWGLEIGVLAEVYRTCALRSICQVDLADNYEHKHQELSPQDHSKGLLKMAVDIAKTLFRTLASEGIVFSDGFFKTLKAAYVREAQDALRRYQNDSIINSLYFDRHAESLAIEAFSNGITIAGKQILEDPLGLPLIPNWSRVVSAIPDFFDNLKEAVEEDNKMS
ncbi:MAG: glycosyl transferase [Candidatus Desulfofervidaceae bacterium]|nr:glycosyl transferase [Candidatus Desulfofervidaceae bacterium]MDL1970700.1 glycosyl transferase [Candidatus Desulfofervidaceae bacterium]